VADGLIAAAPIHGELIMAERARAKRKTKGKDGNGIGHNGGPMLGDKAKSQVYRRWLDKIEHADVRYEAAKDIAKSRKGELGSIYAAAKEDGCNIDAIKEARAKHKLDHLTVAQDYDDMGFVLRLMKSPLAEQLNLFATPQRDEETNVAIAGELAGRRGDAIDENPHDVGTAYYVTWRAAHERGQKALQDTLRE
jgi:hypothetical protein